MGGGESSGLFAGCRGGGVPARVGGGRGKKGGESGGRPATETIPSANTDPRAMQAEVDAYVRGFISQPHGNLQDLIREAQHPKTVQQLSDELDQEIRERLPSRASYGSADSDYMSYVDQKLAT